MASDNSVTETLWFVLLFGTAPADTAPKLQPLAHAIGYRQLTAVRITQPSEPRSGDFTV